jgi:hypothetical protein
VIDVSYCPKCGSKISEEMSFCPKCGAPLKVEQAATEAKPRAYRRGEKAEKGEKTEKAEKTEKHEKHEYGFIGPLIGGLILIVLGLTAYLRVSGVVTDEKYIWAFFLVLIGLVIIVAAVYTLIMAARRHPKT